MGGTDAVQVVGNTAYVTDTIYGLLILDVADAAAPSLLGDIAVSDPSQGATEDVQVVGNLAYVVDQYEGLIIVDVSDPAAPVLVSKLATPGEPRAIQVVGGLAYVTACGYDAIIVDVSDPSAPVVLDARAGLSLAWRLHMVGRELYVTSGCLHVLQVGTPVNSVSHVSGNTCRFDFGTPLAENHEYAFWLGPQVTDDSGHAMDQDQDGVLGEDGDDVFFVRFTLVGHAPTDITLSDNVIAENQPTGSAVGSFTTADADSPDTFTYTLVEGDGDADNASFTIDAAGNLRSAVSFDYETGAAHSVRVRTTDNAGNWYEKQFAISVTNVNEAPTGIVGATPFEVPENSGDGTVVGRLATLDPDVGDCHVYTLADDAEGRFALAGNQLVVADGRLLDYEADNEHTIRVHGACQPV